MALIAAEIEGIVESIEPAGVDADAELVVMGVKVFVSSNLATAGRIRTPTGTLTIDQLISEPQLPGREAKGFRGGTAIVKGNFNTDTGKVEAIVQAQPANQGADPFELFPSIEIEPAENLIAGPLTANNGGKLEILGTPIVLLGDMDARLKGEPPKNEFGFAIKPETIPVNTLSSAEGYHSARDQTFFCHTFTIDGVADLVDPVTPQISITRAQGRNRGTDFDLELRGGFTQGHIADGTTNQIIEVFRIDNGQETRIPSASLNIRVSVLPGAFGRWRCRGQIAAAAPPFDKAPTLVRVRNASAGNTFSPEQEVEIFKE